MTPRNSEAKPLLHYLDKYARDDSIVNRVFDHLRNFGLCIIVLGAAAWKQNHIGMGAVAIWDHAVTAVLALIGFALVWLNHEHLFHKVRNTEASIWVKVLFALVYTIVIVELYKYVQAGRGGA